jgi:ABC-type antimicrobial peptide transport system permease subunit
LRIALGSTRTGVLGLVLREVLVLAGAGCLAGAGLYVSVSRYLRSVLFDLSPTDSPTIIAAAALLMVVALAAGYIPARRAAHVDPAATLRAE